MNIRPAFYRYVKTLLVLSLLPTLAIAEDCFKPASPTDIVAEANKLCTLEDKQGSRKYKEGRANISLGTIGKKLFGASAEVAGKAGTSEYYNVLQKDLIKAVEQRGKCDDILKILVDYQKMLFESSKNCVQAVAEKDARRRQQIAAAHQKKSEVYRTFTNSFKDQTELLFGNGSLVDAIQALSAKESMLTDIEFAFSPSAYDKAASLFETARQSIACAWNEANRPDTCNEDRATGGNHPNDKYNNLYTSLKKQMSADIRSINR